MWGTQTANITALLWGHSLHLLKRYVFLSSDRIHVDRNGHLLSLEVQADQATSAAAMDKLDPKYEECMVASAECLNASDVQVAACLAQSGKCTLLGGHACAHP